MNLRTLILATVCCAGLGGCLQDLEGGPARVQVHSTFADTLVGLSIDSWNFRFNPALAPGGTSETFELPVSGSLDVTLWGVHAGQDTLLARRRIHVGVGEFQRIE